MRIHDHSSGVLPALSSYAYLSVSVLHHALRYSNCYDSMCARVAFDFHVLLGLDSARN